MKGLHRGFFRDIFTVGSLTMVSRVLGFLREMLQSRLIGAGIAQSAFTLAFALPNMARKIFGEGALTAAFIPVFKDALARGEEEAARRLMRAVLSLMLTVLLAVVALVMLALGGFSMWSGELSPRAGLTLSLVRILFPYMIFICGAAFGMGVLNALGRFVEGAFMPVFLNLVWLAALGGLWFFPGLDTAERIKIVCWAILLGGVLQMAFLFWCMAHRGFSPKFTWTIWGSATVRLVWKNTFVGALGAGAVQVNYMLDQVLGQCASPWAAGVIGYAERLMDLPLGVVGVAFGTVLLPTFAGHFSRNDPSAASAALYRAMKQLSLLLVPTAIGLYCLAPWVVQIVYQGGAFDAMATLRVSRALKVYAIAIPFVGLQKCLVPYFQARKDMNTPLKVTLTTVIINAGLNVAMVLALPEEWRHVGLAASTSFCAVIGVILLWRRLR